MSPIGDMSQDLLMDYNKYNNYYKLYIFSYKYKIYGCRGGGGGCITRDGGGGSVAVGDIDDCGATPATVSA